MNLILFSTIRRHIPWVALLLTFVVIYSSAAYELEPVTNQKEARNFSLISLDGQTHQLSDYTGKVVLVSFWATWCPECIFEMPSLQALSNTMPNHRFIILAVNVGEEENLVRSFAEQNNLTFPILLDHNMETYKNWPVLGVPTSFIINQRGDITYSAVGAIEWTSQATLSRIRALSTYDH